MIEPMRSILARIMHECFATVRERHVVARKTTEAIGGGFDDPPRRVRESAKRTAGTGGRLTMPRRGSEVLRWKTHALSGLALDAPRCTHADVRLTA